MKVNEVDFSKSPEGKKNDPKVLMRNSQVAKMSELAMQNFQAYISREMQRRQTQGDSAEIDNAEFAQMLDDYTNKVLLKKVETMPGDIKRNIETTIQDIANRRDNATAMKQNFLRLVANAMSARFSATNVFDKPSQEQPPLELQPGTVINSKNFGKLTYDGNVWKNERGQSLSREASTQLTQRLSK